LRARIETQAKSDVEYALRFADPSVAEDWRKRERQFTDMT
jgi:hypothetical protein